MSDALRTVSSFGRVVLGRLGLFDARRRAAAVQATAQPRGRLFRKYVLLIVGLVSLVLLLNSALDFWFGYDENKAALFRIQQEKAASASRRIEQFVDEIERQLGWTTAPQWAASPLEQRRFDYVRLLRQVPAITELIQLDEAGKEQLKVSRLAMDVVGSEKDYSQSPGFNEARQQRVWFSPVYFRKESEPYMTIAMARTGRSAGVTIAEVNLKLIWDVITGLKIGREGYAYVVDRDGRLIAHPDISLVLRNTNLGSLPQVAAARAEASGEPAASSTAMVARSLYGNRVLTAHAAIAPLGWTVFVELPLNEALAPLYGSALRTAALLVLALVLATLAALLLARRMTVPIRELQAGAARIGAGELDRRIDIHTGDELEGLAGQFNQMAGDLRKSYADLEKKVEERTAELKEALDQQTATAEVLGVINSSPGDLAPVFDAMLEKAMRLCEAAFGILLVRDGSHFQTAALHGVPPALAEFLARTPREPGKHTAVGRMLDGEDFVHFGDMTKEAAYQSGDPRQRAFVELGGTRTYVAVALRKDGRLAGTIGAYRQEVRPFTDKQIALLENFAAQAVIAMENARLITETREALEQQTATAEVLGVINSSPGDLAPVFDTILEKAHSLCGVTHGALGVYDSDYYFRSVAARGYPEPLVERFRQGFAGLTNPVTRPLIDGARFVQVPDLAEIDHPIPQAVVKLGGFHTGLFLPLRKDGRLLGHISAARSEVRPFADKEIKLLENFAAQAVIAMENARLITETREALEQQTATAEVLQVINSSPGDLAPVFDAMLEKALRLCEAAFGLMRTYDGERFHPVAIRGLPPRYAAYLAKTSDQPGPDSPSQCVIRGENLIHIVDLTEEERYRSGDPYACALVDLGGARSAIVIALRRDNALLGTIMIYRQEIRPFSDKEIALLQNFAAQAVIAMENARLLTETRQALEQQTATAEVLQVINSSPGDLTPVFQEIVDKAAKLCGGTDSALRTFDGELFHLVAVHGGDPDPVARVRQLGPIRARGLFEPIARGELVHIPDCRETDDYRKDPASRERIDQRDIRTWLAVPLHKEGMVLGAIMVFRQEVRPFSDKQIALLENFAAQAVIAMENARLIIETREALEQQTATAEVLGVINNSPGDLAPVFDAMLDKALRLCEAAFGYLSTYDGERFHHVSARGLPAAFADFLNDSRSQEPGSAALRVVRGEAFVHIANLLEDEGTPQGSPVRRAIIEVGGARTQLIVALRKDNTLLGIFVIYRQEVRPFTDKQIGLLENFAVQAVIAMENARLIGETREALEQQTATAEVLQVINSSPGDLAPVFDAILEKAHSLCGVAYGSLQLYEGELFRAVATHGMPDSVAELMREPYRPSPGAAGGRLIAGDRFYQVTDVAELAASSSTPVPKSTAAALDAGIRTLLFVPLRKEKRLLGMITAGRVEVQPFSDKQIALLENFAAQAVIAMENARLLTETREALEQQTATAEVLQVINSSPGNLAPVFDAILEKAHTLCGAAHGSLQLYDGENLHAVVTHAVSKEFAEVLQQGYRAADSPSSWALIEGERFIQIADCAEIDHPVFRSAAEFSGIRTVLFVPLRRDDAFLGLISAARLEVRPFSDKQIALLQNFAAQAVIAMENARLITETREALEQQTATAEVLQVINSSPGDLTPVFNAILEKAHDLCGASFGALLTYDGDFFQAVAWHDLPAPFLEMVRRPFRHHPDNPMMRLVRGEGSVQVCDLKEVASEFSANDRVGRAAAEVGGARTNLMVPLRKDGRLLGVITANRQEARPFSDKQIALLENFGAQAVIAMENARLITETREALEQQTATAEVLQVINSSPGDLAPVFDAMLEKAMRLCTAAFGYLMTFDGERFQPVAHRGLPAPFADYLPRMDQPGPSGAYARIRAGVPVVQIADLKEGEIYRTSPLRQALVDLGGARTGLVVALRNDATLLGVFTIYRQDVRPFADKEIALLENFAAQAVIAMENARLLGELRERTRDLQESLEYQTATSDVLKVISRSAFDLDTVLQTVVETAIRLCRADSAVIYRTEGGEYRWAAGHMLSAEYEKIERNVRILPGSGTVVGRAALEARTVHILDAWTDPLYEAREDARIGGVHTMIGVPLLREGVPIGVIGLARRRVEAFSEQEIQLVTTFADQAVIAIENARLFNDLQGRTRDLQESLEYQTATSDVLKVISQSGAVLDSVLATLVETAARICLADKAVLQQLQGGVFRMGASFGFTDEFRDYRARNPIRPDRGTAIGRMAVERCTVHVEDALQDSEFADVESQRLGEYRTMLAVPLLREETVIGGLFLARSRVERFTEKQIELVTTFADQAAIAIENARLFNELRARTAELGRSVDELKLLSEVGQAVSSTLDLRAVLSTVLTRSVGLTGADAGTIFRYSRAERAFRWVETVGSDKALVDAIRDLRVDDAETAMGEAVAHRTPIQIADLAERPSFPLRDAALAAGFRAALAVPLVGAERVLGAMVLHRRAVGDFPLETVRLMQTLASQSVLAIQNARMFREIADKSEQLALASQHKSQFLANMSHELRTPLNAILGYAELLVDGIYGALPDRPKGVLERIQNNGKHLLALINDVLDLAKIEAGQLALTLEDYSLPEVVRSVVTATEPLAAGKGLKFTAAVQDDLPMAHGDARRVSQVLLNLVGNAIKFTDEGEVEIRAVLDKGQFVLTVRDTGPGIADADQERIFGEFQQIDSSNTRKKGGTGLGLAISKRMVEMQGGTIAVDSALGRGSTFRVVLPVHVDEMMEAAE